MGRAEQILEFTLVVKSRHFRSLTREFLLIEW
jgi:hypothetical protein